MMPALSFLVLALSSTRSLYTTPPFQVHITWESLLHVGLALEVLPLDQIRDILVIFVLLLSAFSSLSARLLQALVALRQLAQTGQTVGAELVQDSRDKLCQFFVFAVAVDGKGVGGD